MFGSDLFSYKSVWGFSLIGFEFQEESIANPAELSEENKPEEKKTKPQHSIPELAYHGSLYPLAYDPYFPYAYTSDFLFPALPYYQQPVFVDFSHFDGKQIEKEATEPVRKSATATAAANFKKNPEIPDVPPPPLPVKTEKKQKD